MDFCSLRQKNSYEFSTPQLLWSISLIEITCEIAYLIGDSNRTGWIIIFYYLCYLSIYPIPISCFYDFYKPLMSFVLVFGSHGMSSLKFCLVWIRIYPNQHSHLLEMKNQLRIYTPVLVFEEAGHDHDFCKYLFQETNMTL